MDHNWLEISRIHVLAEMFMEVCLWKQLLLLLCEYHHLCGPEAQDHVMGLVPLIVHMVQWEEELHME